MSVPDNDAPDTAAGHMVLQGDADAGIAAQWQPLIILLIVAAFALRVIAAFAVERYVQSHGRQFLIEGDANGYWELGSKLAQGEDYSLYTPPRHVLRMPGFPWLLAASIRVLGDNVLAARLVLATVGTACCWLTYLLGKTLHMRRTGFWAALYVSVHPLHVGNSVLILSETWFTFWMLLSLLALARLLGQPLTTLATTAVSETCLSDGTGCTPTCPWRMLRQGFVAGILIGLTVLVRPGFLLWTALACVGVLFLLKRSPGLRLGICVTLLLGCGLTLIPWAARNAAVTGHWVFTSLWSGPSLYDGLHPGATGASDMSFFDHENLLAQMSEFDVNQEYKNRAIQFAIQNPTRAMQLAIVKAQRYLSPVPNQTAFSHWAIQAVCVVFWLALFGSTLAALVFRWPAEKTLERPGETQTVDNVRKTPGASGNSEPASGNSEPDWAVLDLLVTLGPFLMFLLVHMVFVGSVRYRLPVEYPLSVLGAIGWRRMLLNQAFHRKRHIHRQINQR